MLICYSSMIKNKAIKRVALEQRPGGSTVKNSSKQASNKFNSRSRLTIRKDFLKKYCVNINIFLVSQNNICLQAKESKKFFPIEKYFFAQQDNPCIESLCIFMGIFMYFIERTGNISIFIEKFVFFV